MIGNGAAVAAPLQQKPGEFSRRAPAETCFERLSELATAGFFKALSPRAHLTSCEIVHKKRI
jgi:hypothetical protein